MTQASDIGELKGLMIALRDEYAYQRTDIGTIKDSMGDIKDALATETRKRIAADAAIEKKIPKPSTIEDKVEVNTLWRNRVIGGVFVLVFLLKFGPLIWKAIQ